MRKIFSILFLATVAGVLLCGCSRRSLAGGDGTIHVAAEPEKAPQSTEDKTAELKEISFQNFEDKTMSDIVVEDAGNYTIDLDEFFNLAGLDYDIVGDDIVVMPISYNREADFCVLIHFDRAVENMVRGVTISRIRNADTSWREVNEFESATDFIFDATLEGEKYLIGADAMDYLWREVRLLTAPADKADEINQAVDAELASYGEVPDDFSPEE